LLVRPSSLPEYERYTVRLPKINIDVGYKAAEKLARDISRALRKAGVNQPPSIELQSEMAAVARIIIEDSVKAIDDDAQRDRLVDGDSDPERGSDRKSLLSIIEGKTQPPVRREVLRLDFDQARTLISWIEELETYPEEAVGHPKNFYYDDDRFNQLLMLLQDATSPGSSQDLDGIIWP
jgi:hypothetical protein